MSDLKYFPKDYYDAKKEFRRRVNGVAEVGQFQVPSASETDLFMDHAYYPATTQPEKLILVFSGVHGAESYAGHAIQSMILDEIVPRTERSGVGFFFVHSLNPYGFKRHQRCTENGVNINRNCSTGTDLYKIQNPGSISLSDRFVPKNALESTESYLIKIMRREGERVWFNELSMDQFIKTAAQGQYTSKAGLEFGGHAAEPQIHALNRRLREIIPHYRDVILLDLHTGLGERARLHLLTGDPKTCINKELFSEILDPHADRAIYDFTDQESEGFYPTFGATNDLIAEMVTDQQRVCALTMEFGTIGHTLEALIHSLNQWMIEHQGMVYGYASPAMEAEVKAISLEKFYPSAADWRNAIIFISRNLVKKILQRLNAVKS